jgi:hypothetical protein
LKSIIGTPFWRADAPDPAQQRHIGRLPGLQLHGSVIEHEDRGQPRLQFAENDPCSMNP